MKKLLIAAIAATMSAVAFADISIKGDAHLRYANIDRDGGGSTNSTGQRVRLHVTGRSGNTTVKLGLRNDGGTRVSGGATNSGDAISEASPRGAASGSFNVDYLFIVTKIGAVTIKAGDWWDTTGLGLVRKGAPNADQVKATITAGGVDVSLETGADDSDVTITVSGKAAGFNIDLEHNTGVQGGNGGYTDLALKGKAGAIGVAAEFFQGKDRTNDGDQVDDDASLVHLWTKAAGITWHAARAEWDAGVTQYGNGGTGNSKFSPLGVSILGSAPGINGRLAVANVNNTGGSGVNNGRTGEGTLSGVRADMKVAGMGVQIAVGNLELSTPSQAALTAYNNALAADTAANAANAANPATVNAPTVNTAAALRAAAKVTAGRTDDTFKDVIITRALGKGSNLKLSWGEWNNVTSTGAKISVKF